MEACFVQDRACALQIFLAFCEVLTRAAVCSSKTPGQRRLLRLLPPSGPYVRSFDGSFCQDLLSKFGFQHSLCSASPASLRGDLQLGEVAVVASPAVTNAGPTTRIRRNMSVAGNHRGVTKAEASRRTQLR